MSEQKTLKQINVIDKMYEYINLQNKQATMYTYIQLFMIYLIYFKYMLGK